MRAHSNCSVMNSVSLSYFRIMLLVVSPLIRRIKINRNIRE